jgi:DNA primase
MRFSPAFLDEIRQRLPVSQVVGRRVKLRRQGREYIGLSPFKHEKSPSFTVNDQKGFYHCFSTGEHGTIFDFVMKTEGLSFTEAVERLANDAGVPLPVASPRQAAETEIYDRLRQITEASARFFQEQLHSDAGRAARDYLRRRGVTDEEAERFRLGYAPNSRQALRTHLERLGFRADEAATAGMLISGEDIATPFDRFRHRLIFPIGGLSGKVIAFGGRALDADQQPKYLNSPETPIFHKGSVLFNAASARKAAHDKQQVIVAEGYMDVIALARAGFPEAVAPLGTALTEEQLALLWRMASEPVMCFDGDAAGRKAALRAVDMALPHLKPGMSLRFAFLPDGLDPDDLVKTAGAQAMGEVIAAARPLIEVFWEAESGKQAWTTPEARAALEAALKTRIEGIADPGVRAHYNQDIRNRLWAFWRNNRTQEQAARAPRRAPDAGGFKRGGSSAPQRGGGASRPGQAAAMLASDSLKNSPLVRGTAATLPPREAVMLLALLNHPWLTAEVAEELTSLNFDNPGLGSLRDAIIDVCTCQNPLDKEGLRNQLSKRGLAAIVAQVEHAMTHTADWHSQPHADRTSVLIGWRHMLALHRKSSELRRELEGAEQAFGEEQTEQNFLKLRDLYEQVSCVTGSEATIEGYAAEAQSMKNAASRSH